MHVTNKNRPIMMRRMKSLLILVNSFVLIFLLAYGVGAFYYSHFSEFSTFAVLTLLVLSMPYVATVICLSSSYPFSFVPIAILLNVIAAAMLFVLGIGASTGLGGAGALILLIMPAIALATTNTIALAHSRRVVAS